MNLDARGRALEAIMGKPRDPEYNALDPLPRLVLDVYAAALATRRARIAKENARNRFDNNQGSIEEFRERVQAWKSEDGSLTSAIDALRLFLMDV
jgi:hypothetical protein